MTFTPTHRLVGYVIDAYLSVGTPLQWIRRHKMHPDISLYQDEAGSDWYLKDASVEPITAPAAPPALIPGKRYRLTVEGIVKNDGHLYAADTGRWLDFPTCGGTVELLPDPLPTTPGSIVRSTTGRTFVRIEDSIHLPWLGIHGPAGRWWSDEDLEGSTVLFDAGAGK